MKIAVIGSRELFVEDLTPYLPPNVTEIVSGGARGIDRCARAFAQSRQIKLTEFLPDYECYGRTAPLKRNIQIVEYADEVVALWDGKSHGTAYVIRACRKLGVPVRVFSLSANEPKSANLPDCVDQRAF